jgi:preprotein translocase subunit YajC
MDLLACHMVPSALAVSSPLALWLQQPSSPLQNPLVPIILMVVIFYLVLFLPMRRRQRKVEQMLSNLKNGDRVVTNGGLLGTIVAVGEDNSVTLRVKPDNVKLQFARSAVSGLIEQEKEQS